MRSGRWSTKQDWILSMEKMSLTALAREQLDSAERATSGRSAHTVYGGHEHVLRQTVIALRAGHKLGEHENSGEATLHVLQGRVRLSSGDNSWDGSAGDLIIVPQARHSLEAVEPSTVLLTVAKVAAHHLNPVAAADNAGPLSVPVER